MVLANGWPHPSHPLLGCTITPHMVSELLQDPICQAAPTGMRHPQHTRLYVSDHDGQAICRQYGSTQPVSRVKAASAVIGNAVGRMFLCKATTSVPCT